VISSTVFATLGALTPVMTSDLPFVETLEEEVIKYSDLDDLKNKMKPYSRSRSLQNAP